MNGDDSMRNDRKGRPSPHFCNPYAKGRNVKRSLRFAFLRGHARSMNESSQHTLGRNICAIHKDLGLSKVDFSLQLGISRVTLDLIEQGRDNLKLSTLDRLAFALGKEPWELLR